MGRELAAGMESVEWTWGLCGNVEGEGWARRLGVDLECEGRLGVDVEDEWCAGGRRYGRGG